MTSTQRIATSVQRSVAQAGPELVALFLCFSFVLVNTFGAVMGQAHQNGIFVIAQARLSLYLLTWTVVPCLALGVLIVFVRLRPAPSARRTFAVFSVYFILFGVATLAYFGTPITFARLLLILCGAYWLVVLMFMLVPTRYAAQVIVLGGVLTLVALWGGSRFPISIEDETQGSTVHFVVAPGVMLVPTDRATLTWDTSNIQAIFADDAPTVGAYTIDQIAPGDAHLLRVEFAVADDVPQATIYDLEEPTADYRFDFKFPAAGLYALWLVLAACVMLSGLVTVHRPQAAAPLGGAALFVTMFYFLNAPTWFPPRLLLFVVPVGVGAYLVWRLERVITARWLIGSVSVVLGILAILSVINTAFATEPFHSTAQYVGVATDTMGGYVPTVDSMAHYGILQTYLVVAWFQLGFLPPSLASFSVFVMLGLIVQLAVLYGIAWRLTRVHTLIWAMIFLLINITIYSTWSHPFILISAGPMRYFPQYVLILLITLRLQQSEQVQLVPVLEYVVLALVFLSEFPVLILTVVAYISISVLEAIMLAPSWRVALGLVLTRIGAIALVGVVVGGGFVLYGWAQTGRWPLVSNYAATYVDDFASRSFLRPFPTFYPWFFYSAALYGTLAYVAIYGLTRRIAARVAIPLFAIAVFGVLQNIYWIQERYPFGIGIMSNIACPALLYVYWLQRTWERKTPPLLRVLSYGAFATLIVTIGYWSLRPTQLAALHVGPSLATSLWRGLTDADQSLLQTTNLSRLTQTQSVSTMAISETNNILLDTTHLVETYEPGDHRVAIFLEDSMTYQVLLSMGRSHVYPVSHPLHWEQDALFDPAYTERREQFIQMYSAGLTTNDHIFLLPDYLEGGGIWGDIVAYLDTVYDFEYVAYSPHGVVVVRLQ